MMNLCTCDLLMTSLYINNLTTVYNLKLHTCTCSGWFLDGKTSICSYNYGLGTCVSKSDDDELSTGVAIAISIVVTFIITLVVTALISVIITSLYYKHLIDRVKESIIKQEGDSHALTQDIKSNDPAYAMANVLMDTDPAYGTATTIKMDTNPAYATTT